MPADTLPRPPVRGAEPAGECRTDPAGAVLVRLSTLPGLVVGGFLAVALPLVLAGAFLPYAALPAAVLVGLVLIRVVYRTAPVPGTLAGTRAAPRRTPWWAVVAVLAVAVVFAVTTVLVRSEQILIERDPASYVQFGWWLAGHGSLPVDQSRDAFGGGVPGLSWDSPAFYQVGTVIQPQFMLGLPAVLAAAAWLGGSTAVLSANAVLGALALVAFGGLAARLLGPRWAPLATLLLAASFPVLFVARSAYSEPLAQLLVLSGLCLLVDALGPLTTRRGRPAAIAAAAAGLLLGIGELVRVDVLRDLVPVVVVGALLLARRRPQGGPLLAATAVGFAFGAVDGLVLSRPYLDSIRASLRPLVLATAVLLVVAAAYVVLRRRGRLSWLTPRALGTLRVRGRRPVPVAAAVLVLAGFAALATRPWWQTTRGQTGQTARFIGLQQQAERLPVDPSRSYYEYALHWVGWWVGWATLVLAAGAAALLVARVLRGREPRWAYVLPLLLFSTAATLWLPSITPDHPWADRRLVPVVLPACVLLATWAVRWLTGVARERATGWVPAPVVPLAGALAMLVPTAVATVPLATTPTYRGQVTAVRTLCGALGTGTAVVGVDRAANVYSQAVRGMCGVPVARLHHPTNARVAAAIAAVRRSGRRPVLLGADPFVLDRYASGRLVHPVDLATQGDAHLLGHRPTGTIPRAFSCWLSFPADP